MHKVYSPLRYPGGKTKIYKKIQQIIVANNFEDYEYIEPFAGGFGVGLALLQNGIIKKAVLNDLDSHLYNFWYAALNFPDELIRLIHKTSITIQEREKQRKIYNDSKADILEDGFATLFLNRSNYSGVLFAGPIGGKNQTGQYTVDCRFNKENIIERIQDVSKLKNKIKLRHYDAAELIKRESRSKSEKKIFYIDPPYVIKGKSLYGTYYTEKDHINLENVIKKFLPAYPWLITYDNCGLVKDIYKDYLMREYIMYHSARNRVNGTEVVITNLPENDFQW